jgi:hypothetical protein
VSEIQVGDEVAFVARGDVILILWKGPSRLARGQWLFDETTQFAEKASSFSCMQIILPSSSPPDKPMRDESNRWFARFAPKLRTIVTVPVGDALWINVVRAIMRTMFMLHGRSSTHFVFDSPRAAARKLRETATSDTPSLDTLLDDSEALLRALGEDPAIARRGG